MKCFLFVFFIFICGCNADFERGYPSQGLSSWYLPEPTASGEPYLNSEFSCAMRKKDFGKYYLVCNLENNKCIAVRHNDFGPAKYLYDQGRIVDLSWRAFSKIAGLEKGLARVRIGEIYDAKEESQ